jgi:hypothetical protein
MLSARPRCIGGGHREPAKSSTLPHGSGEVGPQRRLQRLYHHVPPGGLEGEDRGSSCFLHIGESGGTHGYEDEGAAVQQGTEDREGRGLDHRHHHAAECQGKSGQDDWGVQIANLIESKPLMALMLLNSQAHSSESASHP